MILASQNVEVVPGGVSDVRSDTKERQQEVELSIMRLGDKGGKRFPGFLQKP